jgi:hypothetical protein
VKTSLLFDDQAWLLTLQHGKNSFTLFFSFHFRRYQEVGTTIAQE